MTYLNSSPHSGPDTAPKTDPAPDLTTDLGMDDIFAGHSPLLQAVMRFALYMLAQFCASNGKRGPKTKALLMFSLGLLAVLHGGTREDKRAFLKRLFAKHTETQDRLYAAHLTWRQRKCWMWGGGFRAGALAALPGMASPAQGPLSFDALIPD